MVDIATVFSSEIEKHFRNHLPKEAVGILMLMGEQMLQMERALNEQQKMIVKLMKFAVLSKEYEEAMKTEQQRFEEKFGTIMKTEKIVPGSDD